MPLWGRGTERLQDPAAWTVAGVGTPPARLAQANAPLRFGVAAGVTAHQASFQKGLL